MHAVCAEPRVSETVLKLGSSRLGGKPDLPAAFPWPEHEFGPYRFLGQINMADVHAACAKALDDKSVETVFEYWLPPPPSPLTASHAAGARDGDGLLSFFFAEDAEERVFWRGLDFIKAFYFPLTDPQLTLRTSVPKMGRTDVYTEAGCLPVQSEPCWMLPNSKLEFPNGTWPLTKDEADSYEYEESIAGETKSRDEWRSGFLFGYPHYHTLCYDPTPDPYALNEPERKRAKAETAATEADGAEVVARDLPDTPHAVTATAQPKRYVPLLNMPSYDEELRWCWMDGDRLMDFIDAEDLGKGDLSTVIAEVG